ETRRTPRAIRQVANPIARDIRRHIRHGRFPGRNRTSVCASDRKTAYAMSDPILAKAQKCLAAWDALRAFGERQPVPLYCTEHDEWERQQNNLADAWRDALCDLLATVPTTQQGAITLIDAGLSLAI